MWALFRERSPNRIEGFGEYQSSRSLSSKLTSTLRALNGWPFLLLSPQCHLKKKKEKKNPQRHQPSLSASSLHLMLSLLLPLPHSIPERQTEPDNICSSQHRLISLHTSSERMLSRGVWDISPLRRTGSGTSAATTTEVSPPGFFRRARHVRTWFEVAASEAAAFSTFLVHEHVPVWTFATLLLSSGAWMKAECWSGENVQAAGSLSSHLILVLFVRQSLDKSSTSQRAEPHVILMCLTSENSQTFIKD